VEAEQRVQVAELKDKERREKSKKEEDERTARKKV